jgi:DNA-binding MarR family transcriptional regulator
MSRDMLTDMARTSRSAEVAAAAAGHQRQPDGHQAAALSTDPAVSDDVDDIVATWQRERPDLDVTPLHVLSRVSRLARHLDRARGAAFAAHGLGTWEFDVLSALRRQGPPYQLSPGSLLRATLVTSGTMTNRVDRLAEAGLVSRHRDARDKRGVLVQLTERGRSTVDAALVDLLSRERELLTGLDADQQAELSALLRVLLAPFDAAASEPAAPSGDGAE